MRSTQNGTEIHKVHYVIMNFCFISNLVRLARSHTYDIILKAWVDIHLYTYVCIKQQSNFVTLAYC